MVDINHKFQPDRGVKTRNHIAQKLGLGQSQHREMRAIWDKADEGNEQAQKLIKEIYFRQRWRKLRREIPAI